MRSSHSLPVVTAAPSASDSSVMAGSATVTLAAACRRAPIAGAMYLVWKAPATCSGRSRAPAGGAAAKASRSDIFPAATICPAALTFAGVRPFSAMAASTSPWSPPSTAVIPVGSAADAAAIAVARTVTRRIASSADRTPAMTPAASSPTLCPAAASAETSPASPRASAPAAASAAASSSGCATAVSVISSAFAVVPYLMRSQPASSEAAPRCSATPGSSSQGARNPGVCAPCPGAVMINILLPCPVEVRHMNVERHEVLRPKFVASLQVTLTQMSPSRYRSRSVFARLRGPAHLPPGLLRSGRTPAPLSLLRSGRPPAPLARPLHYLLLSPGSAAPLRLAWRPGGPRRWRPTG